MAEEKVSDNAFKILLIIVSIYSIFFIGVSIWGYEHFIFDSSGDQLLFEQVIYNTAHGKPFYNNFSQQNHFGDHNSPILALLALCSLVLPVPYVMDIFTVLSIALAAIPIYLIARDHLNNKVIALLLSTIFLLLPALVGQINKSFHEINLVLPFLTFSFYFFTKEKFYPFIVTFSLALLVKEDVALTLFMYAPYALIRKRDYRWFVYPALISAAWFFISINLIIPYFNKGNAYGVALGYFGNVGTSLSDIVANIAGDPLKFAGVMLAKERVWYLLVLLVPVGLVLPFLSAEILFAIPTICINLIAENTRFRLFVNSMGSDHAFVPRHMSLMAVVFLFIATIYSIKKVSQVKPRHSIQIMYVIVVSLLLICLRNDRYIWHNTYYTEQSQLDKSYPSTDSIKTILSSIPNNSTVKADLYIANHLYSIDNVYYQQRAAGSTDYIILSNNDHSNSNANYIADIGKMYCLVAHEKNIELYKRK